MKRRYTALLATALLVVCAAAPAAPKVRAQTYYCALNHFVRDGGAELRSTAISIRNPDTVHPATVERLTIRNVFGDVVHDSGPAAGTAHPLNTDFASPLDITIVPPGGSYYLVTRHIWGLNPLPEHQGGNQAGFLLSATLQVAKAGPRIPVFVGRRDAARTRLAGVPVEGDERSSTASACVLLD